MKELRKGMTLTVEGRTWEIFDIGQESLWISSDGADDRLLAIDLARLLPWDEPVGEWVTEDEWNDCRLRDPERIWVDRGEVNKKITRKYGQPPVKGGAE